MELRPIGDGDAELMEQALHVAFTGYRAWAPVDWQPPDRESELERIRGFLAVADRSTWGLLAFDAGRPAGLVSMRADPSPETAYLWQLFVRPRWWGTGLAVDLLARFVAEASGRGHTTARLFTPTGNARGRRFYEREGWATHGEPVFEASLGLEIVEYRRPLP